MKTIYNLNDNKQIKLLSKQKVFYPTQTTKYLLNSVFLSFPKKKNISFLDLGCGAGVIGVFLLKYFKNIKKGYFLDLSSDAINLTKKNLDLNRIKKNKFNLVKSNLFSSLKKEKFDIIINDVSGISDKVAKISPWFNHVPCDSGEDGTKQTIKVFNQFSKFLKKEGIFYTPIISFCNEKKIFSYLKKKKYKFKEILFKEWPIPKKMHEHKKLLKKLKNKNKIFYTEKFNFIIAHTRVILIKKII